VALALLAACGGGGGGGGGGSLPGTSGGDGGDGGTLPTTNGSQDFILQSAYLARPLFDHNGVLQALINPSSLWELDPLTGLPLPGFPKPLTPGIDLGTLTPINFAQILDPVTPQVPLVPRNAAIVLSFSFPVDPASLHLDNTDPAAPGKLNAASPLQVRRADGSLVAARAVVDGKQIALFAQSPTQVGWEASPLVFDTFGLAVEDPSGTLRIVMGDGVGPLQLLSATGSALVARLPDKLGSLDVPLPFNPGNSKLDPLALQTEDGAIHFNGFLPDLTSPRIVRPVALTGTVFDASQTSITGALLTPAANTAANQGQGEWAGALLEVTDSETLEVSQYVVTGNTAVVVDGNVLPVFEIDASNGAVDPGVVGQGDAYTITRTEYYEPIPPPLPVDPAALADITVDPANHPRDPLDAQDLINHDLRFFVRMYDEAGVERTDVWNPAENLFGPVKGKFGPIPPRTTVRLQFSEPMEPSSFRPYETCYVTDAAVAKSDPALRKQRVGRCVASTDLRTIAFEPFLEDQFEPGASEFIGFGGTPTSLKLVLRSIPEPAQLTALVDGASPQQLQQLVDLDTTGVLGLIDLGGRGLGLPAALLDSGNPNVFLLQPTSPGRGAYPPAVDFAVAFQTLPSDDPDFGVVVHRFMGQATSSVFSYPPGSVHDEITKGVEYHDWPPEDTDLNGTIDRRYIYGPFLPDIGLNLPGRLTGAPANTIEHLMDDFNKPKPAPFSSPNGQDFLPTIGFGVSVPLNSPFGCRFQHVFPPGRRLARLLRLRGRHARPRRPGLGADRQPGHQRDDRGHVDPRRPERGEQHQGTEHQPGERHPRRQRQHRDHQAVRLQPARVAGELRPRQHGHPARPAALRRCRAQADRGRARGHGLPDLERAALQAGQRDQPADGPVQPVAGLPELQHRRRPDLRQDRRALVPVRQPLPDDRRIPPRASGQHLPVQQERLPLLAGHLLVGAAALPHLQPGAAPARQLRAELRHAGLPPGAADAALRLQGG
jgi:hypothetical protein